MDALPNTLPALVDVPADAVDKIDTGAVARSTPNPDAVLSESARRRILDAVPDNTRDAYARQWAAWVAWCAEAGRTALPATAETLAAYVAHLADEGRSPSTIEQAMAAVAVRHRAEGHTAPVTVGALAILRGHRRDRAEAGKGTRQAPPVTVAALRAIITAAPSDGLIALRNRALLVLGVAMMARASELVGLDWADVAEVDEGLVITIRTSKTDRDSEGRAVALPYGSTSATCPVRTLRAYRAALAEAGVSDGRVFRAVTRHGKPGPRLSADAVSAVVRSAAVAAGLPNADAYSGHSLRSGGATAAYKAGKPVSTIAKHGRWSPTSPTVLGYIRGVDQWEDNAMGGVL